MFGWCEHSISSKSGWAGSACSQGKLSEVVIMPVILPVSWYFMCASGYTSCVWVIILLCVSDYAALCIILLCVSDYAALCE